MWFLLVLAPSPKTLSSWARCNMLMYEISIKRKSEFQWLLSTQWRGNVEGEGRPVSNCGEHWGEHPGFPHPETRWKVYSAESLWTVKEQETIYRPRKTWMKSSIFGEIVCADAMNTLSSELFEEADVSVIDGCFAFLHLPSKRCRVEHKHQLIN